MPALTIAQIAEVCAGSITGDPGKFITGANTLEQAGPNDISYVANRKAAEKAALSRAGCLLVGLAFEGSGEWSLIRVTNPRAAFARVLTGLYPPQRQQAHIHPTAVIASSAFVAADCAISAFVVIGANAHIEPGCRIGNGCSIGEGVRIGSDCTLHAGVTLYDAVRLGSRVILHSGCVVGADGFGFTLTEDHYEKFPQVGTVEIGDDVEIGANCCIDRAALGATRIGDGTKLDNMVHVAHNCNIGKHVVVAAQTGFSGSVTVGDYAVIGGQVGIGEQASIDARAIIGGKAGILTSQRIQAGEPVWGVPARPLRQHLKGLAYVGKMPELREEVRELRRSLEYLEARSGIRS